MDGEYNKSECIIERFEKKKKKEKNRTNMGRKMEIYIEIKFAGFSQER